MSAPAQARVSQRVSAVNSAPRNEKVDAVRGQEHEGVVGHEELDEERRAAEDEDEPLRGLAEKPGPAVLGERQRRGHDEARGKREGAEVDVPDHARGDERELLAQRDVAARKQAFPVAEGAEAVVLDGLPAAHAAAFRRSSPAIVAWPRDSLRDRRSSAISESLVIRR